jgi:hypothetical protein
MPQKLEKLIFLKLRAYESFDCFPLRRMEFAATFNCVESPVEPASKSVKLQKEN